MLTTTKQLGRFLLDNGLRLAVDLSRRKGFTVTLERGRRPVEEFVGTGATFPDAVDAALVNFSRYGARGTS